MRKQIGISIFIAQAFFFATIQGFAQQTPVQQSPSIPEDVLGQIAVDRMRRRCRSQNPSCRASEPQEQQAIAPTIRSTNRVPLKHLVRSHPHYLIANQDGNRFIPSLTNGVNESVDTRAKY